MFFLSEDKISAFALSIKRTPPPCIESLKKMDAVFRLHAAKAKNLFTLRGFPEAKSLLLQKRGAARCYRINTRMAIKYLSCSLIDFHHMMEEHGSSNQTKTV